VLDVLATYVHDLDPVIFSITEKIKLRWYGLSYVMGFIAAYYVLIRLARKNLWVIGEEKVGDIVTYTAIFGVFLGGRIGYVLFYMITRDGFAAVLADPLTIIAVWDGGMASHGGILGIMFFTLFHAWRHKLSWPGLGDGIAIVAPLGVFFGRVANFINGELYGTVTDESKWWAVKFPKSLYREDIAHLDAAMFSAAVADEKVGAIVGGFDEPDLVPRGVFESQIEPIARENPAVLEALGNHVPARHPSQLYEGVLEGLVIFLVLYGLRVAFPKLWHGVISGIFFILYAVFRIGVENVREPDAEKIFGATKGQFYSFFMIAIGIGFLLYAWRSRKSLTKA
jgi:phosphatidylglycerol:prolipoprotein diacylglycerol transferase